VVVLTTDATEEQQTTTLGSIEEVISRNGGTILPREVWGKRRLAYPIEKRRDGYYAIINFTSDANSPALAELNRALRISENVLRYLVTSTVVGKSKGNVLSPEELARLQGFRSGPRRPPREGGYRGGDAPSRAPEAPVAPVAAEPAATEA
jgi:small subunit ribosomal protein S6